MKSDEKILKEQLKNLLGKEPLFYLKFTGCKEWGQDILNGNLFMNTIEYFRELELKTGIQGQGDRNELKCTFDIFEVKIIDKQTNQIVCTLPKGVFSTEFKSDKDIKLFCLTGITLDDLEVGDYDEDKANLIFPFSIEDVEQIKQDFGEYVVLIDGKKFRQAIHKAANDKNLGMVFEKVIYCEPNTLQRIKAFEKGTEDRFLYKDILFEYQKEYRLAANLPSKQDNYYEIGDISDFAHIFTIEEFLNLEFWINYISQPIC